MVVLTILIGAMVCVFVGWGIISILGEKIAVLYLVYFMSTSVLNFTLPINMSTPWSLEWLGLTWRF